MREQRSSTTQVRVDTTDAIASKWRSGLRSEVKCTRKIEKMPHSAQGVDQGAEDRLGGNGFDEGRLQGGMQAADEPVLRVQPNPSRYQYERLSDRRSRQYELFRQKEDENCPFQIMSYMSDQAESVDKPTKPYNHYSLLVYICNISCFSLLGFPLAFPFMICATATAKSVKNLNEQNDFVSSRMCHWCVWLSLFMTVLMGVASWVCIGLAIYYAKQLLILAIVIIQVLLVFCGSLCLPFMKQILDFIRTSKEIKKETKAMIAA